MKYFLMLIISSTLLFCDDLKIVSDEYQGDNKKGVSTFSGDVKITLKNDKLNADKIVVNTDKENKPTKLSAYKNVNFHVETQDGSVYEGSAQKALFYPKKKIYEFYDDVKLFQLNNKKEITGDFVKVDLINSTASAKSKKSKPVVMVFDIKEENNKTKAQK